MSKVFCICCNFEIEPLYKEHGVDGMWNDGAVGEIYAGYGSRFDDTHFRIAICDSCLETNLKYNKIEIVGKEEIRKRR